MTLKEILENLSIYDLVDAWNRYCENNGYYEDYLYDIELLDDVLGGLSATEIIEKCGEVNTYDDYFVDGIYGIESVDKYDVTDKIYIDDLADYIENNPDDFDDISEISEYFEENT